MQRSLQNVASCRKTSSKSTICCGSECIASFRKKSGETIWRIKGETQEFCLNRRHSAGGWIGVDRGGGGGGGSAGRVCCVEATFATEKEGGSYIFCTAAKYWGFGTGERIPPTRSSLALLMREVRFGRRRNTGRRLGPESSRKDWPLLPMKPGFLPGGGGRGGWCVRIQRKALSFL